MKCPDCKVELTVFGDSANFIHPGKPSEEAPDCPVMYYNKNEGRLWYTPSHDPRFKEVVLE